MTLRELLKSFQEHLETYPQDLDLVVKVRGNDIHNNIQWYPEEGYVTFLEK